MEQSIRDRLIRDSFVQFTNLVNDAFIPLCVENGIKPTKEFILESMRRGCIPAERILKKVIAKEVSQYYGEYLSKQRFRRKKIEYLQDTLMNFINVLDHIKKSGIIRIWNNTGSFAEYDYNMLNISKMSSPELILKQKNISINF